MDSCRGMRRCQSARNPTCCGICIVNGPEDTGGSDDASLRISWGERLRTVKNLATRLGPILSKEMIHTLDASISYLETGRWLKSEGFVIPKRVESQANVYDQLINALRDQPILYLEFGVWQGRSIRYWSERLRNPDSRFHGFDSFEGSAGIVEHALQKGTVLDQRTAAPD